MKYPHQVKYNCVNEVIDPGIPCQGNFPGFCTTGLRSREMLVDKRLAGNVDLFCKESYNEPSDHTEDFCPDKSNTVFCADTINCDQYGLFK